ncbi:hypothetical protein D3C84_1154270 [compost metagenome]
MGHAVCLAVHHRHLPLLRHYRHRRTGGEHGAAAGLDVSAGCNADPARYRRYRIDHGYGGRRQRTDLLADT